MIVSIHQPQFLPWLPYLLKIKDSDLFIILDSVDFQKNGIQNRNMIKTSQGASWLTVPVKHSLGEKIIDIKINNTIDWKRKHWQTLSQNYRKARYYNVYAEQLEIIYQKPWENLVDLNLCLIDFIMGCLNFNTKIIRSSNMNSQGKGSELILNLCKEVGAKTYISGVGGKNYLNESSFIEAGIEIIYKEPKLPREYPQQFMGAGFLNDLSVIDIILNCGPEWAKYLE